jgi:hypothetical protein
MRLGADGALRPREVETLLRPAFVYAVDVADFDGDGRDEIVIGYSASATGAGALELLSFPAGSRPPRPLRLDDRAAVAAIATGDIDGDGALDVVAALQDGRLITFRGDRHGSVTPDAVIDPPAWRHGCAAYAVRLADLDADTRAEIIATFAGEPPGCPSGGGIEVWASTSSTDPTRRRSVRR